MNCISGSEARSLPTSLPTDRLWSLFLALITVAACGVETSESADRPDEREYDAHYSLAVDPANSSVDVSLEIRQAQHLLRVLHLPGLSEQFEDFQGDGEIEMDGGTLRWLIPTNGGRLHWRARVNNQRRPDAYDAWLGPQWGIFRAEDIIPRAKTRSLEGSTSNTSLSIDLPTGWSAVTEYSSKQEPIAVKRADRRFDQPTGWMVVGEIGVRRDTIAGVRVAIAGPEGHAVRRLDMLALLNWTLPELVELLPDPPARLTIVSAGEPMWRGGLSAPASLYVHADRPLISENATSTLLHEVLHTWLSIKASEGYDWIVEGLAEYYSLELLRRGMAISATRHAGAINQQADWAKKAKSLCGRHSTGATTALAVTVFWALNQEIVDRTSGASDLDDLLRQIVTIRTPVDLASLSRIASGIIGEPSDALHIDNLPGCSKITPDSQGN